MATLQVSSRSVPNILSSFPVVGTARVCLFGILLGTLLATATAQQRKRVAVLNFDYGTVQSSVAGLFGTNVDVGKGVSDLLVQKLVGEGKCSVIERSALDKVLAEQNLSNSDRADSSAAIKIGRLLGVEAVIVGTITQFGRDDKNTTIGATGKVGDFTGKFGLGGLQKQHAKAVVGVTARLIDTSTAEILAAVTGTGVSTRAGTALVGGGGGSAGGNGAYDMSSKNFGDTILGEAVHKAVDSLGTQLETQVVAMGTHRTELVSGLIADVSDNTLVLNVGSSAGLHVGETLDVSRATRTVKDPTTGQVIKTVSTKVGTATVTEVDEKSATATYDGSGPAKVGDTVRAAAPVVAALPAQPQAPQLLTNEDVITMYKGGLGESTLISAIQSQDTNFDISAKGLLQLKKAGTPPKVMDAVVTAAGKHKAAREAAAKAEAVAAAKAKEGAVVPAVMSSPIAPTQPSILISQGGVKQPLPTAHAQILQTKTKPSTLAALASDASLAQATASVNPAGMPGKPNMASAVMMMNPMTAPMMMAGGLLARRKQMVTDVWLIMGAKSETVVHNAQPSFEILCDSMPGINAEEYEPVLLKLEPTSSNFRLVGATEAKLDALQAPTADWGMYASFVEERVAGQATKVAPGHYQLHASSALVAGEYAIALRPISKDKKFSGASVSQNTGDGLVFNSLWSFEVAQ